MTISPVEKTVKQNKVILGSEGVNAHYHGSTQFLSCVKYRVYEGKGSMLYVVQDESLS